METTRSFKIAWQQSGVDQNGPSAIRVWRAEKRFGLDRKFAAPQHTHCTPPRPASTGNALCSKHLTTCSETLGQRAKHHGNATSWTPENLLMSDGNLSKYNPNQSQKSLPPPTDKYIHTNSHTSYYLFWVYQLSPTSLKAPLGPGSIAKPSRNPAAIAAQQGANWQREETQETQKNGFGVEDLRGLGFRPPDWGVCASRDEGLAWRVWGFSGERFGLRNYGVWGGDVFTSCGILSS